MTLTVKDAALGAAAGFGASYLMTAVTTAVYARQDDASLTRERELAPSGAPALAVLRSAQRAGIELDEQQAERYASLSHQLLPFGYGVAAAALTSPTRSPLRAALLAAAAGLVLVDEGPSLAGLIPPPQQWPIESHVRGIIGHLTLGVGMGALLTLADRVVGLDARRG